MCAVTNFCDSLDQRLPAHFLNLQASPHGLYELLKKSTHSKYSLVQALHAAYHNPVIPAVILSCSLHKRKTMTEKSW